MKACPFCAEEIQDAAIVCKHCGRDLVPAVLAWETEARALSREPGKTVHAVQRVKIANPSMSLKEAKDLVDRWQREDGTVQPAPKTGGLTGKLTGMQQLLRGLTLIALLLCCAGVPQFFSADSPAPPAPRGSSTKQPAAGVPVAKPPAGTVAPAPRAARAPTGTKAIAGDSWFGCADRDQFKQLVRYATQGDADAFKRGLAGGMLATSWTQPSSQGG